MSSPASVSTSSAIPLSLNKHKYYFYYSWMEFMPSQYFKRFSRILFIMFILCTVCKSPTILKLVITCHLPYCLIFDDHIQLRVDNSVPTKIIFWSSKQFNQHSKSWWIKIRNENNRKQHELYHVSFPSCSNSDTLSNYIHTSSFSYGIGAVFVYFSVIAMQNY